jgi:hypothetical protein
MEKGMQEVKYPEAMVKISITGSGKNMKGLAQGWSGSLLQEGLEKE